MRKFLWLFLPLFVFADNGWNSLHEAVFAKNYEKAKSLINKKSVESTTTAGLTPLHIAVKIDDLRLVQLLLQNGADIESSDKEGRSALHYAVLYQNKAMIKYLLENDADPNDQNNYGITPLHQAAYSSTLDIVKLLVLHGADPNIKNDNGHTAYDLAKMKKHGYIEAYLKDR